jgi:membrane protein
MTARVEISRRSPWRLGGLGARGLAARVWDQVWAHEVLDRAAALSYYFLFALFPTLLFLTALLGLMPEPALLDHLLGYAARVLPPDAMSLLRALTGEVVRGAGGELISVGVLGALWGASRGVRSIITALNVVYDVQRPRPWWRRQVVSVVLTVTFCLFTLTGLLLLIFGERIGRELADWAGLGALFAASWSVLHWVAVIVLLVTAMDLVYYLAPAVRHRWHWLTPGAAFALTAWLAASLGLRLYVTHVGDYNATYGSIGGVILLLLWLYVTGAALLVGAQINAVIAGAGSARRGEPGAPPAGPLGGIGAGSAGAAPAR